MKRVILFAAVLTVLLLSVSGCAESVKAAEERLEKTQYAQEMKANIACGDSHFVCLLGNGTVFSAGGNASGQSDTTGWTDIAALTAGCQYTAGLKEDGSVVTAGKNSDNELKVDGWNDIVEISGGWLHLVGLRSDGTAVATGLNEQGQCEVGEWTDIVHITAGMAHTVGLKSDGTLVSTLADRWHNVDEMSDIISVAAGVKSTMGIEPDGTLDFAGSAACSGDHGSWKKIIAVAEGRYHIVGLQSNGKVVADSLDLSLEQVVGHWEDIVAISAGSYTVIGLKADGTVVGASADKDCQNWQGYTIVRVMRAEDES